MISETFLKIDVAGLHSRMKRDGAPHLVDVRSSAEYADGHVAGSISIPLEELDRGRIRALLGPDAGEKEPVYLVCASGLRAEWAAKRLLQQGLPNLTTVEGGTQAWVQQHLPIRRVSRVLSLERQTQIAVGVMILLLLTKGAILHPLFYALTGLLGIGLIFAGVTARCGLASILARMPWNQRSIGGQTSSN